ncbi:MAG TPA: two-component regulator propeller domain-containing protein [Niabella sp.]|nr:two-component regulator propeller domain-containing protein [Niabella sp.]HOZ97382.1 two-component regulator propeller domain-containing protein [Niabella sp.]HQW15250.1 two-component regulator propeller domain-containing protein [Niabella sp.]HQX20282.1 two-component regulator propeller domain-containing protein [Niabella sp.]HRB07590.1 two-component regulator propeller domain-containing protein [Niabella sp.]
MKQIKLTTLLFGLLLFGCNQADTSSEGQKQISVPKDAIKSETKETVTSYGPNTMVRNVKQDRNGNILIASYKGVFRYDGKSFTNITSTISSPSFWDVLEDRKGNLWFATRDSGVYYYNDKSLPVGQAGFQHFTTREGLASNTVFHIYEDRAGNIWFGTGGGLSRYDGKSFRNFTTKEGLSNNNLTTIMEDKTGKLWFGTRGEPCFYDGKTFTVFKNEDGKAFNNVWSIIEDKKGNIWLGDNDGLWRYDGSTTTKVTERGASFIIEDKKGNIWTTGSVNPPSGTVWALSRYDQKSLYNKKPIVTEIMSIKGPGMLCGILEANDGSIWFGALGPKSGVYRYDGKTITDFKSKEGNN